MEHRFATSAAAALASFLALAGFGVLNLGPGQTAPPHISFVLATGSSGGTYFPVGQAIAEIISHPPGVARCDAADVCGPPGLIASTRTSPGSVANVLDVDAGRIDSGLAQSDIVAEAAAGKGDFRKTGPQSHLRVIADLFPEEVHVVAASGAHIAGIADLRDKRVALGGSESGTARTARAVLAAYRLSDRQLKITDDPPEIAAQRLARGEIDAFFFVGGAPVELAQNLIGAGKAVLVPIDGRGRARLLREAPGLVAETIPAADYPGLRAPVETVGVEAVWIVNDAEPADLVYAITKALFDPANRALLDEGHPSARLISLGSATKDIPAPLHPGAARFFREKGIPLGVLQTSARRD